MDRVTGCGGFGVRVRVTGVIVNRFVVRSSLVSTFESVTREFSCVNIGCFVPLDVGHYKGSDVVGLEESVKDFPI